MQALCVELAQTLDCNAADNLPTQTLINTLKTNAVTITSENKKLQKEVIDIYCMQDIIYTCKSLSQVHTCRDDLEEMKAEVAAGGVKIHDLEKQLEVVNTTVVGKETRIKELEVQWPIE